MSCAKAAVPAVAVSGAALAPIVIGAAAVAIAAIIAIKALQAERETAQWEERRREKEAIRAREEERTRELLAAQTRTKAALETFAALASAQTGLAAVQLAEGRQARPAPGAMETPAPPVPQSSREEQAAARLMDIERFLAALPHDLTMDAGWPQERFMAQARRYQDRLSQGRTPSVEELASFHETISRTMGRFIKVQEAKDAARTGRVQEAMRLLGETVRYRHLALDEETIRALDDLAQGFRSLPEMESAGEKDETTRLTELSGRFEYLRSQVDAQVQWAAFRSTLSEAMVRHLGDLGYRRLADEGNPDSLDPLRSVFAAPGGERLTVTMGREGRMDFGLAHERRDAHAPMTDAEIQFFRRQEDQWANDFRELIRRLTKEGFSYQIEAESLAAQDAIPIVVVETAEEIMAEEETREGREHLLERTKT
jgi:hypothetical protein